MAIAYVQQVGSYSDSGSGATSHVVTITNAPTTGNHLTLDIITPGAVTISSVTDTKGNTWTVRQQASSGTSLTLGLAECYVANALTTSDTITITISASQGCGAICREYSGGYKGGWYRTGSTGNSGGIGVTSFDSNPTALTGETDDLHIGLLGLTATSGGISISQSPFTARTTVASVSFIRTDYPYDGTHGSTAEAQFSGTYTTSRQNVAIVALFRADNGGTVYVLDTWSRSGTATWASADIGGDYTGDGTPTDATGSRGTVTHSAATSSVLRLLSSTAAQDVDETITVRTDKVPTGAEVQIRLFGRMQDTANYYRVGIYPQTSGSVVLEAHAFIASVAQTNFISATHGSLTWTANTDYKFRVQFQGVSPTTVRLKVWDASLAEPTAWDAEATNSESALQTTGFYGIGFRTTSSLTNFPIVGSYDNWLVQSIVTGGGGGPGGVQAGWTFGTPAGGL